MNVWTYIWIALVAALVIVLWRSGQFTRIANYVRETREELRKCSWPTWNELKGSTVVVMISIFILGGLTVLADLVFLYTMRGLTSL